MVAAQAAIERSVRGNSYWRAPSSHSHSQGFVHAHAQRACFWITVTVIGRPWNSRALGRRSFDGGQASEARPPPCALSDVLRPTLDASCSPAWSVGSGRGMLRFCGSGRAPLSRNAGARVRSFEAVGERLGNYRRKRCAQVPNPQCARSAARLWRELHGLQAPTEAAEGRPRGSWPIGAARWDATERD